MAITKTQLALLAEIATHKRERKFNQQTHDALHLAGYVREPYVTRQGLDELAKRGFDMSTTAVWIKELDGTITDNPYRTQR